MNIELKIILFNRGVNKKSSNLFLHHNYHHSMSNSRHQLKSQDFSDSTNNNNNNSTSIVDDSSNPSTNLTSNAKTSDQLLKYNMFKRTNKIDWAVIF